MSRRRCSKKWYVSEDNIWSLCVPHDRGASMAELLMPLTSNYFPLTAVRSNPTGGMEFFHVRMLAGFWKVGWAILVGELPYYRINTNTKITQKTHLCTLVCHLMKEQCSRHPNEWGALQASTVQWTCTCAVAISAIILLNLCNPLLRAKEYINDPPGAGTVTQYSI